MRLGTFSYLPQMSGAELGRQIDPLLAAGHVPAVEYTRAPAPGDHYWTMWKLPLFAAKTSREVQAELAACRAAHPDCYVRLIAYDRRHQTQVADLLVHRPTRPDSGVWHATGGSASARPVMVAVGGDSGTGKTTLTRGLVEIFGEENVVNICLDDYHLHDRAGRAALGVTALDPAANNIDLMQEQIWLLRRGESVVKPVYDHGTGTFGEPEESRPGPIVLIRGLFPLFNDVLRQAFDVRVWLDPDPQLKRHWKIKRDVAQRGYAIEEVERQIEERREDLRRHIEPQRAYADLVVRFAPASGVALESSDAHLNVRLSQTTRLPKLELDDILEVGDGGKRPALRREPASDEQRAMDVLEIDGTLDATKAAEVEERLWEHMHSHRHLRPDEIGTYIDGTEPRHSDPLALTQLLVAYFVVRQREEIAAQVGAPAIRRTG
ncbi:MAG: phosphoribulokinase [Chloroflexota bacterium]|nr:phosphoribulokinase [Chloroflexota bacterium]